MRKNRRFYKSALRLSPTLSLVVAWVATNASLHRFVLAAPDGANDPSPLVLRDPDGRTVLGIVCDNLVSTPLAEQSHLLIDLPRDWRADQLEFTLSNSDGSRTDKAGHPNVGSVEYLADQHRLRYTPPLEFNFQQAPDARGALPITATTSRIVRLTVTDKIAPEKQQRATRDITLKRPTVVLVHGINSSPGVWTGANGRGLGALLSRNSFVLAALHHGYNDRRQSQTPSGQAWYFNGNGPVEFAAACLERLIEARLQERREAGFAARRVDVVAHSYGGLITRWSLKMMALRLAAKDKGTAINSRLWYVNSKNDAEGANLYWLPKAFWDDGSWPLPSMRTQDAPDFAGQEPIQELGVALTSDTTAPVSSLPVVPTLPVRKVITLASMWRGVPLCNYLNEIRGPAHPRALRGKKFSKAPLRPPLSLVARNIGRFVDKHLDEGGHLPTRVPAMEVMAVNSRWLQFLNETPFVESVAYGSVAGDDNAYLPLVGPFKLDLYSAIHTAQRPPWFLHLRSERLEGAERNFSDGVVPVWSAALSGSHQIVAANHSNIVSHAEAKSYVMTALCNADLPDGKRLKALWDTALVSRAWSRRANRFHTWLFDRGVMPPRPRGEYYQLVDKKGNVHRDYRTAAPDAVARIAPSALQAH